jgi:poly(3-hydroxybutyrate) depolymerase
MQPSNVLAYELAHLSAQSLRRSAEIAHKFWSQPIMRQLAGPMAASFEAASILTQRSLAAMVTKPGWKIDEVRVGLRDVPVTVKIADAQPFGDLLHFDKGCAANGQPKILLVAPKSGHYATLLRETVARLLPEADVYLTDWRNAREVPVEAGKFDIEDYVEYLLNWFDLLGPDLNVIAVCQPAPLALVAAAAQEKRHNHTTLSSLTLMGGPINPHAAPTEVTEFADRVSIDTLKRTSVHRVGHAFPGKGRFVYPGAMQLSAFMSMNLDRHAKAFQKQWLDIAKGDELAAARHNQFYDEYLAVMDMTAEFYLSTVERIFQKREVGLDQFTLRGEHVALSEMKKTPLFIIEGGRDDVAAPGQCAAALDVTKGLPKRLKRHHVELEAGHYAIFSGSRWRNSVAPKILDFIRSREAAKAS